MKYGYMRTSTKEQNEQRQVYAMHEEGIADENIYMDKMSGKDFNRPEYQKLVKNLQKGDILYILSIDRLGRNYDDIIEQWHLITKEIEADIVVIDMPLLNTTTKNNDLTGRFVADLVLQILSYVAQKEREAIKARQMYGIQKARDEGRYRKKDIDMDLFRKLKKEVDDGKITVVEASKQLGMTRGNWYYMIKHEKG